MLEDVIDLITIHDCDRIFQYLDSRLARLTVNMDPSKGKGLVLLRFCNELLRRLSKTKDTATSGQILIFLANVFPLSERSGVNLRGDFNVDNVTFFDTVDDTDPMDVDGAEASAAREEGSFYQKLWSLQPLFSNPPSIAPPTNFEQFKEAVVSVVTRFESLEVERLESMVKSKSAVDSKRKPPATPAKAVTLRRHVGKTTKKYNQYFFPKYLTSRNLFKLELLDISFRRQVLIQVLVMVQFLIGQSAKEKEKLGTTDQNINKSVQFAFTLNADQEKWCMEIRSRVMKMVERSYKGKMFFKTVYTIFSHEKNWIKWKHESCQSFERPSMNIVANVKRKKFEPSIIVAQSSSQPCWMGSDHLTKLWNTNEDWKTLLKNKAKQSHNTTLDEALKELDEQLKPDLTPADGMEEQYLLSTDMQFNWRTYRTAMRHHLHLFQKIEEGVDTKALVREWRKEKQVPVRGLY
ncbi:THO complex, subunit THOC1 [Cladochytrium replicatum]|nr:THO complex, subunit THOC1 [Cladochytrium replicatum]